jgi:endonuclease G, mitochondrial
LTGPVFHPTQVITLKGRQIEVPVEFWKIVIRRDEEGEVDAAGIVMTKEERRNSMPVSTFVTTIDDIESRTGIDFFPDMAVDQEEAPESACPSSDWELEREVFATFPGIPRPINEEPPRPRSQSLGTQFGHDPVCAN